MTSKKHLSMSEADLRKLISDISHATCTEYVKVSLLVREKGIALLAEMKESQGRMIGASPRLLAACRVMQRYSLAEKERKIESVEVFAEASEVYVYLKEKIGFNSQETFGAIFMQNSNMLIEARNLFVGGMTECTVDITVLMKAALDVHAKQIVLYHNHPSGNLEPSVEDIRITKKIDKACKLMDLVLLDHLIVTQEGYTSMREREIL